jgi:hypothetical protein
MDTDSEGLTHKKKSNLIEESTFNQAFKRVKGNLTLLGQRLIVVFSNYSETLPEVSKAVNHLTGGKGFGHLVKILFLFLLTLAVGFGVEMLFSILLQKHKRQLQSTVPQSFLQLIARLSARTVIELISFAVFALTIAGLFLIFYPIQSPLYFPEPIILTDSAPYADFSAELPFSRNVSLWVYDPYHHQPCHHKNPGVVKRPRHERRCVPALLFPCGPFSIHYLAGHTLDGSGADYTSHYERTKGGRIPVPVFHRQNKTPLVSPGLCGAFRLRAALASQFASVPKGFGAAFAPDDFEHSHADRTNGPSHR